MAIQPTFYNPDSDRLEQVKYTWNDLVATDWQSAVSWDDYTGTFTTSPGDIIRYTTQIIDNNRIAYVNPTITVDSNRTANIKIYTANQIDSSSQLPGSPSITGSQNTDLTSVQARYFQFEIDINNDNADAFIEGYEIKLNSQIQQEFITADSSTHSGTEQERVLPITKTYSAIQNMTGSCEYVGSGEDSSTTAGEITSVTYMVDDYVQGDYTEIDLIGGGGDASDVPVFCVRSISDVTQPKYAVFTTNGTPVDATVHVTVTGLPQLRSDSVGNIQQVL